MKYADLVKTIDTASRQLLGRAAAVVNQALILRNWLTGAYIVEFEQHGEDRASYGTRLIECLAQDLAGRAVKGASPTNLRLFREFYRAYPQLGEGLPDLLPRALAQAIRQTLSVESNSGGRRGRAIQQTASVKSCPGQRETIEDLIRDPYVLEFTGLAELPQYTESDLETALLDHLQKFLLELGTGFCFEARQFRVTKVEFATAGMSNKLLVSRYLTVLPSAEQLQRLLEGDRARIEALTDGSPSQPAARQKKPAARPARKK